MDLAGLILTNPEGMEFTYALRFEFTATRMGVRNLEANVDSRLVANHVLGEYDPSLLPASPAVTVGTRVLGSAVAALQS
ncbi:hypothetical protein Tco_0358701, partial [Tanacetum coccineum]